MAFTSETLAILRNFARINKGIVLQPGNVLKTMSAMRDIFAKAVLNQEIEEEFVINDLKAFLRVYSLSAKSPCFRMVGDNERFVVSNRRDLQRQLDKILENAYLLDEVPETTFTLEYEKEPGCYVSFIDERSQTTYLTGKTEQVIHPGNKEIRFSEEEADIRFTFSPKMLSGIRKMVEELFVNKDAACVDIMSNGFRIKFGSSFRFFQHPFITHNGTNAQIKMEIFDKLMSRIYYDVAIITSQRISRFTSLNEKYNLVYYLALKE